MKNYNQFKRGEAAVLAIALAVAGALALLNQLLPVWGGGLSWNGLLHTSPYLLAAVALSLIVAEEQTQTVVISSHTGRGKEGKYVR